MPRPDPTPRRRKRRNPITKFVKYTRGTKPTPKRKPPEAGIGEPVVPPRGPLPNLGGVAARINQAD